MDGLKIAFNALIQLNNFSFVVTREETDNCCNDTTDGTQGNLFLILIRCSSDFHHNGCAVGQAGTSSALS